MAATLFVQPLDLVKNRMQLSGKQKFLFLALDKLSHPICVWSMTCDFQQCGILTSVDLDEPAAVQPPFKLRLQMMFGQ